MPDPDLVRAVRAACRTSCKAVQAGGHCRKRCMAHSESQHFARMLGELRAALAELEKPSETMLGAVPDYRNLAEHCWRAMMRKVLRET